MHIYREDLGGRKLDAPWRLLLLLIKWKLKWCYHRCNCYRGTVQTQQVTGLNQPSGMMTEKVMFKLLPKQSKWRCSFDGRQQGIAGQCSWQQKCSIIEHSAMHCGNNQCHGVGSTMTSFTFHISSQLEQLGEVWQCSVVQAPVAMRNSNNSNWLYLTLLTYARMNTQNVDKHIC